MPNRLKNEEARWISVEFSVIKFHQKSFSHSQIFHPDRGSAWMQRDEKFVKVKRL